MGLERVLPAFFDKTTRLNQRREEERLEKERLENERLEDERRAEQFSEDERQLDELPAGTTLLRGQYHIDRYLVRWGCGITYLARDSLDRQYVIKECFPGALCCRAGGKMKPLTPDWDTKVASILRHFLSEARRVAKLDHPNIVRVHQVFEENDTAYIAMERVRGDDLLTVVDETPLRLTPRLIDKLLRDALKAIDYIHDLGILHRDISPDNFLLGPDEHLTMIDCVAAREHAGKENRALSALLAVKDGYSPHEFYLTDVDQTASSDLYSLGATFYHLITGEAPPNSQDRVAALAANQEDPYVGLLDRIEDVDPKLPQALLVSVDQALEVLPRDRITSAREWLEMLDHVEDLADLDEDAAPVDKDLTRTISRLVEDTNRDVHQGMPGDAAQMAQSKAKKKRAKAREAAEAEAAKPKQKVDIFGNPISNVEAWLKEQSKPKTRRVEEIERPMAGPRRTRLLRKPPEPEVEEPPQTPRKKPGRLSRLVSSYVPTKRSASTPMTTKGRPA